MMLVHNPNHKAGDFLRKCCIGKLGNEAEEGMHIPLVVLKMALKVQKIQDVHTAVHTDSSMPSWLPVSLQVSPRANLL